jgi:hypothetical protein
VKTVAVVDGGMVVDWVTAVSPLPVHESDVLAPELVAAIRPKVYAVVFVAAGMGLPPASASSTAGAAPPGEFSNVVPSVTFTGPWLKTTWAAGPTKMVKLLLVADRSPVAAAWMVRLLSVLCGLYLDVVADDRYYRPPEKALATGEWPRHHLGNWTPGLFELEKSEI